MLNFPNSGRPAPEPAPLPGSDSAPFEWLPGAIDFVHRRLRLILGCGALGLALGVAYLAVATPRYTAIATLSIDPGRAHPVGGQEDHVDWQSESAYIESQVVLIQSPATLRGVVTQLHLDQDPLFAPSAPGPIGRLIASIKAILPGFGTAGAGLDATARAQAMAGATLSRMLEVWRVGTTSVVEVRVRTPSRELSARLANAVTEAYMAQQLVAISETTQRAGGWLESRIGELRGQAVAADRAVQEYKAKNDIVDVATGAGTGQMNEQQLSELNVQVANARSRVAATQARYEQAEASMANGVTQGMVTDTQPNPVMAGLQQQYLDATRHEADLTARMGPTHGAVVLQHRVVVELEHGIQSELARQTETYRADFMAAQANLRAIQAPLAEQVAAAAKTNIERSELRSLQSSADAYRLIYGNFLQRFTQAMQDQSYPISDARVAAPALAPMDRSSPKTLLVLAIATTLGLALGVMIAVAREALNVTVRTVAQLRQATGLDYLGAMPSIAAMMCQSNRRWSSASPPNGLAGRMLVPAAFRLASVDPDSEIIGAVHRVRVAAARRSARGRDTRMIGCVSMQAGEGTSTFAANLAFALAADGQRAILVDWNTKAPWLTEILSPFGRPGLQELAAREASLTDVVLEDQETGLRFIGQSLGRGPRLQPGVSAIHKMLTDLRDQYDFVVLDLPPLRAASAVPLLSEVVDGFVLVARSGSATRSLFVETLSRTAAVDAPFLGAVLSRCDPLGARLDLGNPTPARRIRAIADDGGNTPAFDDATSWTDTSRPGFPATGTARSR
jgi:succinoglycan biosynthesis transport protein ExoP